MKIKSFRKNVLFLCFRLALTEDIQLRQCCVVVSLTKAAVKHLTCQNASGNVSFRVLPFSHLLFSNSLSLSHFNSIFFSLSYLISPFNNLPLSLALHLSISLSPFLLLTLSRSLSYLIFRFNNLLSLLHYISLYQTRIVSLSH